LDDNEPSSINNQVYNLMWWDAVFWTLNEARKYADKNNPSSALTPILAEFIDQGYVALQVISISKLLEKNSGKPRRGIISLRRLVDEVVESANLFTREIYVCYDGLPFDPEPARQRFFDQIAANPNCTMPRPIEGPDAWEMSQRLHAQFDKLSGVTPSCRKRDDLISVDVFKALQSVFDDPAFEHVINLRHKVFAHAADAYSRSYVQTNIKNIELDQIIKAQKNLLQLMQIVSSLILQAANFICAVAIPQFNQFDYITCPYIRPENRNKISTFWNEHTEERCEWLRDSVKTLLPNFI
jgi:hypothetical protein